MPLLDSDLFTYSDGALPTVSSAKWTQLSGMGVVSVTSNTVTGASAADSTAVITTWSGSTTDQYAQCACTTIADGGATLRSNAVSTFYVGIAEAGATFHLYKCVTTSFTELGTGAGTPANGDTLYVEMIGSTLLLRQNGTQRILVTGETSIASGSPGIHCFGNVVRQDAWVAGDFAGMIAFVNSTAATIATAASTWSIATHSSRVGGAAFVVGLGPASSAVTISTVTDNTTNVYLLAARALSPIPTASAEIWYVTNISSASTRVSVTLSGNSSGSLAVGQFTGVSTANPLLSTSYGAITANSTVHTITQITPSSHHALVVGFYRCHASTMSPTRIDGSFNQWVTTAAAVRTMGLYQIQDTAASTAKAQWRTEAGSSGGVQHSGVLVAFSDTGTGAAPGADYVFWGGFGLMGVQ